MISKDDIDELRVRYVNAYLCILPLKYALATIGMSEDEYYRINDLIDKPLDK